jgi:tripartite-type tricarboxylate transporter receptor subunit TctC
MKQLQAEARMLVMTKHVYRSLIAFGFLAAINSAAFADGDDSFYKGKSLSIQVGYAPGGGYDLNTRLVARRFGAHVPGNPTVVVENMPGAGSMKLANYIYNVAPKDGTVLGVFAASIALEPLFKNPQANYDTNKFSWIGSLTRDTPSCGVWNGAGEGIKTLADLSTAKHDVLFGSSAPSATTSQHAFVLKNMLGAHLRVIHGYPSTSDIKLALQRGELTATCGLLASTVQSTFMDEYKSGVLKIIVQFGTTKKVPLFGNAAWIYDAAKTDDDKRVLDFIFKQAELARPLAAPPNVPKARVEALRKAMLDTMKDPDFIADAAKMGVEPEPVSGEETAEVFASYFKMSDADIKRGLALMAE